MSLKLYTTYTKKDKDDKVEDIAITREEFSFTAFLFNVLWFLRHKMWVSSAVLVLVEIALINLCSFAFISGFDFVVFNFAFLLLIGMNATNWLGQFLQKRGYIKKNYVLAQNEEEARLKAMKSWHRNSPNLSFKRFSEEIIDPDLYLKSVKPKKMKA